MLSSYHFIYLKSCQLMFCQPFSFQPGFPKPLPTEVALMLKLTKTPLSPYVIQMYDWFEDPKYVILVLEHFHPSECLCSMIHSEGRLKEANTRGLMCQLVKAVQHCLRRGVFHTDIHTSNILVDRNKMKMKLIGGHVFSSDGYNPEGYVGELKFLMKVADC